MLCKGVVVLGLGSRDGRWIYNILFCVSILKIFSLTKMMEDIEDMKGLVDTR